MILSLIRHASTDATGTAISGCLPGIPLNSAGRREADELARCYPFHGLDAVFTSPLDRARETAAPLAARFHLPVQIAEGLRDIDFGIWSGGKIADLDKLSGWKEWNLFRNISRIPKGETLFEVQARVLGVVSRIQEIYGSRVVAIVSHADPIRMVLAYCLGMPVDLLHRMEISPASHSAVRIESWGAQVLHINQTFACAVVPIAAS